MNNTIKIHSFSKFGNRNVTLLIFDRLLNNGMIKAVTNYNTNVTKWYFKPLNTILK